MLPRLPVGSRVIVNDKLSGTIRYLGCPEGESELWVGVELEKPVGRCRGDFKGVEYFSCDKRFGMFVKPEQVRPYAKEFMAAAIIVAAARRKLAWGRLRATRNWRAFNTLDNNDEHRQLMRRSRMLSRQPALRVIAKKASVEDVMSIVTEPSYDGPHLRWPLTVSQVYKVIMAFRDGKRLHYKYVLEVLAQFRDQSQRLPTLQTVTIPEGSRLTVCGDTHGQLEDLYSIFTINGAPSSTNTYLFNGDFVDRGGYGVEITISLFLFALLDPGSVVLNRGNHEERSQNEIGGFMSEVLRKYNTPVVPTTPGKPPDVRPGLVVYEAFQEAFNSLPLATLIEKDGRKVFVCHGGLFERPGVKLSHIMAIKRRREIPTTRETFEDKLFEDLMWSDPKPGKGTTISDRGAGVLFGPDITENFCAVNGVSLVIRSHECMQEGFSFHHDHRCVTVFSASRYCRRGTNKGAFIIFEPDFTHTLQQFIAGSLDSTTPVPVMAPSPLVVSPSPHRKQHEALISMIIERTCLYKADLYWYFANVNDAKNGRVSKIQWCEGMRLVLELDLPWVSLCDELADIEADGTISFPKFLDRYRIDMLNVDTSWQESIVERVCQKLFGMAANIEQFYKRFDINSDGLVEYTEFVSVLESLDLGLSRAQIYELMGSIDVNKDGCINFDEFVSRFQVVFTRVRDDSEKHVASKALRVHTARLEAGVSPAPSPRSLDRFDPRAVELFKRLGAALFSGGKNHVTVFASIDTDGNGLLSYEEFSSAVKLLDLEPPLTRSETDFVIESLDSNGSGEINYLEFVSAFRIADVGDQGGVRKAMFSGALDETATGLARTYAISPVVNWQQAIIQKVVHTLFEYRIELNAAFEMFDVDGSGRVSAAEFRNGLRALTGLTGVSITDSQADAVLECLDHDGDGALDYVEFLSAFKIVDTKTGQSSTPVSTASPTGDRY